MKIRKSLKSAALAALAAFWVPAALADGIVSGIVNSPLSAAGLVRGAHSGINVLLQSPAAPGLEFMDPGVIGYGIPAGGRIEIEMGEGFERVFEVPLTQKTLMVVTGAPQQGMPGAKVGYEIDEGETQQIIVIRPSDPAGLKAETLMSPAPGAKGDPVRQRGIKVFHIGFLESAFVNKGERGSIEVRVIDGAGKVVERGSASVDFLDRPVPQIQPTNLPDGQRNHNWQAAKSGQTLGKTPGSLPLAINLYAAAKDVAAEEMVKFKGGLTGVGVLSTQQLKAMDYTKPEEIARYNGGLILQDANGDGILDPSGDRIVGGVIGKAPAGAKGQELKSLEVHGARNLSMPASAYNPRIGKRFGGAIALLQFTAGDKPGLYRPTLALLSDPDDLKSGDGASYTFTIVVE